THSGRLGGRRPGGGRDRGAGAGGGGLMESRRVEVHGTVQGVGFRPYVYRLARSLGLRGTVCNADGHVVVEAVGAPASLAELVRRLPLEAPAQAVVTAVAVASTPVPDPAPAGFQVLASSPAGGARD